MINEMKNFVHLNQAFHITGNNSRKHGACISDNPSKNNAMFGVILTDANIAIFGECHVNNINNIQML